MLRRLPLLRRLRCALRLLRGFAGGPLLRLLGGALCLLRLLRGPFLSLLRLQRGVAGGLLLRLLGGALLLRFPGGALLLL